MATLYHYVHCPFCLRVRLAAGALGVPFASRVLAYDDEKTPLELTGKKMLPIWQDESGAINESLDIVRKIDADDRLQAHGLAGSSREDVLAQQLAALKGPVHRLAMPYWIYTPEFNEDSRRYFQQKKEAKRGRFADLVKNKSEFETQVGSLLQKLEGQLEPFFQSRSLRLEDIWLAAQLWGLYIVPEFQFSRPIHRYLQEIKKECLFDYHGDFWK